ncbi:hypothetical protein NHQ30_003023 [Ciborinia camelliae]|nr:hypothetical protein NHQ30_003023 [Ciborinia camelliae]
MESSSDKEWAQKYLIDPLYAPEPSAETGPGSRLNSSIPRTQSSNFDRSSSTKKTPKTAVSFYPTPPSSASPTKSSFSSNNPYSSHRKSAFSVSHSNSGSLSKNLDVPAGDNGKGRRRGSSLGERYPGDMSHRPLDQLRRETKTAYRSPHLRKQHIPGADIIDTLDRTAFGGSYHHGGPYDATLIARNTNYKSSPVAAVEGTNQEAIRATPRENIQDSLDRHIPLSGTAVIPPGMPGPDGSIMNYEEGADLMRERDAAGGAYKRWDHVVTIELSNSDDTLPNLPKPNRKLTSILSQKYLPEDYKGKGEPSFSLEKAQKERKASQKSNRRPNTSDRNSVYEMQAHPSTPASSSLRLPPTHHHQRRASGSNVISGGANGTSMASRRAMGTVDFSDDEGGMEVNRRSSTGKSNKMSEGLKRRFGSFKRSLKGGVN